MKKREKQARQPSKRALKKAEKLRNKEIELAKKNHDVNLVLVEQIQPAGGIFFNKSEKHISTGDGYEACIHVYDYAQNIKNHWLSYLLNIAGAVTTVDVSTEDQEIVRENINKSMREFRGRYRSAKDDVERMDAEKEYHELQAIYNEISSMSEVVEAIVTRIYVSAGTQEELDKKAQGVITYLSGWGYKSAIFINEQKYEWLAMYGSYGTQMTWENKRFGQPYLSSVLASGYPFHFSDLKDDLGTYWGMTNVGGSVLFDMFKKDKDRLSYNAVVIGKMGTGKSTTLKKLIEDNAARGYLIRGFDVTGEFSPLILELGGKIISLDGSQGRLNIFEILKTDESQSLSWSRHISKLSTIYKFLVPGVNQYEANFLEQLIRELYVQYGLIPENDAAPLGQLTGLAPEKYPIASDFVKLLQAVLQTEQLSQDQRIMVEHFESIFSNLVQNYGDVFNGPTTIENIMDEQIVYFNIKSLMNMKDEITDALIFNILSLCWDNCLKMGIPMKEQYEAGEIAWEDITRCLVLIDEAHKIINTNKIHAVKQILVYAREARKYFGGLVFASQSARDFVPEGSDSESINHIKTLFELTQYKFIMAQDSNLLSLLQQIFDGMLTGSQLSKIPRLGRGETILCLSGKQSIEFTVEITERQRELFSGGA